MDILITTTSTEGLSPLGPGSSRGHLLLTDTLRARLGEDHAALLADPVQTGYDDRFDWYSTTSGTIFDLESLSPEDRDLVRERLLHLATDVSELATEMQASGDAQDVRLGVALAQSMEVPSEKSIYAIRGSDGVFHPVLVNWGFVAGSVSPVRGVLTAVARPQSHRSSTPAVAAPLPLPPQQRAGVPWWLLWLGWLLLALMLAAILVLLIRPCALNPGPFAFHCPLDVPVAASTQEADRRIFEDQIAALERELALADRTCQPTEPETPEETPQRDALDDLLDERGGQRGDLNFALFWDSVDDLDLHVTCPTGANIYFSNRSACKGTLDVDANATASLDKPVENVFFDNPDAGAYRIRVNLYTNRSTGPKRFTVRVRQRNGNAQNFAGVVSQSQPNWRQTITVTEQP